VIGAFVRGLSMRDTWSLCEKAGLGKLPESTAQRICGELRERFEAFKRGGLYEVQLAALLLDAVFLSVRPEGPKEGVLVAWGFSEQGERVPLAVLLGMRESHEHWLALGSDLIARGLGAPLLVVADGAPGLIKAVEQCWPASDHQHCAVHRLRNLLAKPPERERERVRQAYWRTLDDATDERDAGAAPDRPNRQCAHPVRVDRGRHICRRGSRPRLRHACNAGANEIPTSAPSSDCSRATVCPHGSVRCSHSRKAEA
jgi:putative transposase